MSTKFIQLTSFATGSELYYNIAHIDVTKLQYNGRFTKIVYRGELQKKDWNITLVKETPEQIIKLMEEKK